MASAWGCAGRSRLSPLSTAPSLLELGQIAAGLIDLYFLFGTEKAKAYFAR